jgi:Asp-tRNA(Asn)/Glu-tRNA(Gln) amidotransferase A subunit family amidase
MRKAMISQPMRGKTEEQVRIERKETIDMLNEQGYEVVDTVFPDFKDEGNVPLKYLAKSLEFMADVDYVYFMDGWRDARGCRIEHAAAVDYGIEVNNKK